MKIKFERKPKFNFLTYVLNKDFFYKFYFFFTIICFSFLLFIFFQTGFWDKNKKEFLKRINLNGIVNYKYLPKITITKPLIYSKYFFSTVQKKIEKKIKLINKEDKNCIIAVASNTVNLKAKSNIKSLTKKIYKQNNFNFFESILITLDKNKLKDKLENLNQGFDKFMILPIFLFRGKLLENLNILETINLYCVAILMIIKRYIN